MGNNHNTANRRRILHRKSPTILRQNFHIRVTRKNDEQIRTWIMHWPANIEK